MKIGIVIHSLSGKSITFGNRMLKKLTSKGHSVNLEGINPPAGWQFGNPIDKLEKNPDISKYDVVILGAPVMAFSLSPVMAAYLKNLKAMNNQKVFLFVSKGLPFKWTGGNQAMGLFEKICNSKKADVIGKEIIHVSKLNSEPLIDEVIKKII